MQFAYRLYPDDRIVAFKFTGKLTLDGVINSYQRIIVDPLFRKDYIGISDWRMVQSNLTLEEVRKLVDWVIANDITHGRWVAIVDEPLVTAYSIYYSDKVASVHDLFVCSTKQAASKYFGLVIDGFLDFETEAYRKKVQETREIS